MATAQTVDLSTLSEAQRKEVLRTLGTQPTATATATKQEKALIEHAKEWAGLGQAVGSGVVAAAKELGVAANEFAQSDLGKVTVAVLLWKYMGAQMLGVIVGIPLMVFGMAFGWHSVRRAAIGHVSVEYHLAPVLWGLFSLNRVAKREFRRYECLSDSQKTQQFVGYVLMAASFGGGLACIF